MRATVDRVRDEASSRGLLRAPLLLFGNSLGGMVALEWAASYPEELAGVAIAASSASDVSPLLKRYSALGFVLTLTNRFLRDPERRQRRLAWLVSSRRDIRDRIVKEWIEIERARPVSFTTIRAQMGAASNWKAPRSLGVRSLFLVGLKDRLVHPDCSRALARRYGAPLEEHPDAGHDLTTDAPDWVAGHLVRYFTH
jgi:pimeloyl-ACP methyl ester carboxylesterase